MSRTPRPRATLAVAAAGLAVAVLTGCSSSSDAGGAADWGGSAGSPAREEYVTVEGADSGSGEANRAVVITGTITLTADDPIEAAEDAARIVTAAGGRIDAREQSGGFESRSGSAYLLMRIPAASLDDVREQIAELGRVESTHTTSTEVGVQQRDLDARITTLTTSIARYNQWLETAQTTKDLIELESAIADRQTQLERLEAERRALADQVAMSTIELYLYSDETAPSTTAPGDFGSALAVGWNAFTSFWVGATVVLGVLLPWLVLAAIGVGIAVAIVRSRRQRTARAATAAAVGDAFPAAPPAEPPAERD